jgi:hypothetical protein
MGGGVIKSLTIDTRIECRRRRTPGISRARIQSGVEKGRDTYREIRGCSNVKERRLCT